MSRKRSKADYGFTHEDFHSQLELHGVSKDAPVPSYASFLRNRMVDSMDDVDLELSDVDCCFSSGMEGEGLFFSERAREVLERPCKSSVVVRLMGKANSVSSFDFMLRNLRRKWRSNDGWKLVDLLNDWFIVKFELEEDMEAVLCEGPWVIAGQTLIVKRWSAGFDPVKDTVGSMPVWARIVGLPVLYFADYAMKKIGQLLGEVVMVDAVTLGEERERFARVCVEMDLSKPFKSSVIVDKVCYKVQCEGLSLLCFFCGVYGHTKEKCPSVCSPVAPVAEDKSVDDGSTAVGGDADSVMGLAMGSCPNGC